MTAQYSRRVRRCGTHWCDLKDAPDSSRWRGSSAPGASALPSDRPEAPPSDPAPETASNSRPRRDLSTSAKPASPSSSEARIVHFHPNFPVFGESPFST